MNLSCYWRWYSAMSSMTTACGPKIDVPGHHMRTLCYRMIKQIENGTRNITEPETFYLPNAFRSIAGEKLDAEIGSRKDLPRELIQLAKDTTPTGDDIELGYAMPPARLRNR